MKRTHVGWSLGALAGLLLSMGVGPARAAEPDEGGELVLNSEFMVMDSFGTDLNVFELKIEDDINDGGDSTNTGSEIEHDEDFGWRGDLQYKDGAWGLGISGFHFDNEGSESKFVRGDQLPDAGNNEVSLRTAGTGQDCNEQFDDETANCFGSVDSELKVWMVDLYGIRELVSTPDVGVDLQFGLRIADYEWDVDALAALVLDKTGGTFPLSPENGANPVGTNSTSDTDDPLVGPFMSLMTTGRYGRFRVDGQLTQAVVFGELDQSLRRAQYLDMGDGGTTLADLMLQETAVFGQDQDAVIPITDLRIKLGYDILDSLTLGFGAYATTWFNVPEPPNVEAIDRTIGNSSISSDEENLTFLGASFSIEYRFGGGGMPDVGSWMP